MTLLSTLKITFYVLIFLAVILEATADILFKKYSINSKNIFIIGGMLLYAIGTFFWAISLKYEYLSKAIVIFTVLNLIIISLVGIVLFKEELSLLNKIGIAIGILSVALIET